MIYARDGGGMWDGMKTHVWESFAGVGFEEFLVANETASSRVRYCIRLW